jgi:hypothetical protein
MPVLPGNQAYSPTIQELVTQLKTNPDLFNILNGAAGYSTYPALTIANEIMCRILAENMPWKWNRKVAPPFLTVSLQQDYVTNILDIGWLEDAWRVDINNSTSNNNGAPKPIFAMETVRDDLWTSTQSVPFNISFVPNTTASLGLWQPETAYSCGYGVAQLPRSPIQQFMDVNGNILFIDSTQLGLNIESPGFTGTTIGLPSNSPYGVSGSTQPAAVPNATPGTLVQDNTVIWTVADPNGFAFRLNPTPALNGLCWFIVCQYQVAPPRLLKLTDTISPVPNQMAYLFRQGMRAALYRENGNPKGMEQYSDWEETLMKALRAGDRQQEDFRVYPERGAMGIDGGWSANWQGIGAAWPFGPGPYGG